MNNTGKKGRLALGRGLSSLISSPVVPISAAKPPASPPISEAVSGNIAVDLYGDEHSPKGIENAGSPKLVDRSKIVPNPAQPRKSFVESDIQELATSIKNVGVIQPILVRPGTGKNHGMYEIVAGERRWRATGIAGIQQVPVIIKELSDWESLEIALVENVHRAELNPVEEARGYQDLMDRYSLSQQDVADRIGKDRATVANILRVLRLPADVQSYIQSGELSLGHAKAILGVKDTRAQLSLAKKSIEDGLSVRALEALVSNSAPLDGSKQAALLGKGITSAAGKKLITSFPEIVEKLRRKMGTKVMIRHNKSGKGKIEIEYFSESELQRLVDLLS